MFSSTDSSFLNMMNGSQHSYEVVHLMICSRHFLGTPTDHLNMESGPLHCSTPCKATPPPMMVEATSPPMLMVEATPPPTIESIPSPKVDATPPPKVEATPSPKVNATPAPTVEATPTPTVESIPSPKVSCKCRTHCHSKRDCACRQQKIRCTELCHPAHSCVNVSTTCCDTVDLTHCVAQSDLDVPTRSQLEILTTNAWLDDSLMNLGQKMLSQQYPNISGFQSVVLSAFVPQPDEFIQILNLNNNHWIVISTIGCPAATVNVYDSLHGTLPSRAQRVVADILQCQSTHMTVRYPDVQWQSNSHDCGLFTLANAVADLGGVRGVQLNPPFAASSVNFSRASRSAQNLYWLHHLRMSHWSCF